ncbi:hypothetical protein AgCh_028147 [Apium graveolens]
MGDAGSSQQQQQQDVEGSAGLSSAQYRRLMRRMDAMLNIHSRNKPREVLGIGCGKLGAERSKIRSRIQNFPEGAWAPAQDAGRSLGMLGARSGIWGGRPLRNLGRPLRDENFNTEFYNPYSDGLLRWLVLVGFYICSSQRRFTKKVVSSKEQGEKEEDRFSTSQRRRGSICFLVILLFVVSVDASFLYFEPYYSCDEGVLDECSLIAIKKQQRKEKEEFSPEEFNFSLDFLFLMISHDVSKSSSLIMTYSSGTSISKTGNKDATSFFTKVN